MVIYIRQKRRHIGLTRGIGFTNLFTYLKNAKISPIGMGSIFSFNETLKFLVSKKQDLGWKLYEISSKKFALAG